MRLIDRLPSWLSDSALTPTKNWRLVVFVAVFAFTAVGGLIINYSRTAQYRARARLGIGPAEQAPGDTVPAAAPSSGPDSAFLTEVQLLTTRPALEDLA